MKRCPKCGAMYFCVTAHVIQKWVVDEYGDFISSNDDCVDVAHFPDDEDIWECNNCGFRAIGMAFNVKEGSDGEM